MPAIKNNIRCRQVPNIVCEKNICQQTVCEKGIQKIDKEKNLEKEALGVGKKIKKKTAIQKKKTLQKYKEK